MLLTVWMYAYLRGVLSTRAVEDRCRYDATFRVACGRLVPDHTTFSRFRQHLFAQQGLAEDLFYQVLQVCAAAGLGRLSVVAGDGVKIAANASKEASRTEAGLRKLAGQVMAGARKAAADEDADKGVLPGTDLLLGADTAPGPDPRSRAGRVLACLHELEGEHDHDDFESFVVAGGPVADAAAFRDRLAAVIRAHDVLRVKGFVDVPGRVELAQGTAVGISVRDEGWVALH